MKKIIGSTIGFTGYLLQIFLKKSSIAKKLYSLASKYDNYNNHSLTAYGVMFFEEEKYNEAIVQFRKIKKKQEKSYMDRAASMNIALSYWELDSVINAIEELEDLRARYDYLNADILTSLAYFYILKEEYDEAIDITKEVLKDEPEHAAAIDNIGQIYYRQGELEIAEGYFLKALKYKDIVDSKYYLGLIYEKKGNRDKAEEYFRKAYDTKVSRFSTVSKDDLKEKFMEYNIAE